MNAGVAVVDPEVRLLAWNTRAEDLWGVRADEAIGARLLDLDIGLPLTELGGAIDDHLGGDRHDPLTVHLDAVNRRGRPVRVRVTLTKVMNRQPSPAAAVLVMDVVDDELAG